MAGARDDAAENAAAAQAVDLIAGEILDTSGVTPGQGGARLTATVYNAGPRDVEVLSIHPTGWTTSADVDPRTAAAGEWTSIRMEVAPDCEDPTSPSTIEVAVRAGAGDQTVTLDTSATESPVGWM